MWIHGQALLPPSPPQIHLVPPQHPQHPDEMCSFCFNNIQPNEGVLGCSVCHKEFHYGELITWLMTLTQRAAALSCPACRGDMTWVFYGPIPDVVPQPPPQNLDDDDIPLGVQPAEIRENIDGWNWDELLP